MLRTMLGFVVGIAAACPDGSDCPDDCDGCRDCVIRRNGPCETVWFACNDDPICAGLSACIDTCWVDFEDAAALECARACRGMSGSAAVELYDESRACVEDACTLPCDDE